MSGRPVHLLAAAAIAAAASLLSASAASAGCFGGCGGYAAPVAHYSAPVVYSYSYAAPVTYAAPSCGCGGYAAYQSPMYVVNHGPTYTAPVTIGVEEEAVYQPSYRRAHRFYGEAGPRWRHRHGHRGYGHRGFGHRHHYGQRHGYRHHGRYGMHRMHGPRMGMHGPRHMNMPRMHRRMPMNRMPGVVFPK